ncbi:hypothetical protein [Streptomyces gilvosporeus]|uniref:Uncharacterized protein n=1 Tax=Streptomyces gilvosporeus TaxID=553510 RepID=A0A1V0TW09_9ACTN|nr:hypothetical protein [Streptomyces gilvosporeus]ARF57083.1 hypothetical protein B1H19_25520 [Streptomyces gilvosporeus]
MTDGDTAIKCTAPKQNGDDCGAEAIWRVTPDGGDTYDACGQHITAPLFRNSPRVPFIAVPI